MFGIMALLVFLSIALAGYALAVWGREREEAKETFDRRLSTMAGGAAGTERSSLMKDQRLSQITVLNAFLTRIALVRPLVKMIRQAGLKKRAGEVLLYIPLLAMSTFLLTMLIGGRPGTAMLLATIAGLSPLLVLMRMRSKRMALFAEQLPDSLDLIRAALQAGHGFLSALQVVVDEFPDPIAAELRDVAEEIRLGLTPREALYHLVERVDDPNLPILVIGILVTQEVGGNLAEVLDNVSYTIRERFKLLREMRTMTAQGRLSGMVLTALPFFAGAVFYFFNPTYFKPMIEKPMGHYMLAYALGSVLVGNFVIRRIVTIRV